MLLYSTVQDKKEKAYISKVLKKGSTYPWDLEFIGREFDGNTKSGEVVWKYEIKEKGIYKCEKVDGVNPSKYWDSYVYAYIDPNYIFEDDNGDIGKGFGERIKASSIPAILSELLKNNPIDVKNLSKYEK